MIKRVKINLSDTRYMVKSLFVFFIFLFLLNSTPCFAQENRLEADSTPNLSIEKRKRECKIGVFSLFLPALNIEYERLLNTYTSFGVNGVLSTGLDDIYRIALSPFYRVYFTETKEYGSKGLFVQTFLGYYNGIEEIEDPNHQPQYYDKDFNAVAFGFGIGAKWINKRGHVFQFVLGRGRSLIKTKGSNQGGVIQGDLYIGRRR